MDPNPPNPSLALIGASWDIAPSGGPSRTGQISGFSETARKSPASVTSANDVGPLTQTTVSPLRDGASSTAGNRDLEHQQGSTALPRKAPDLGTSQAKEYDDRSRVESGGDGNSGTAQDQNQSSASTAANRRTTVHLLMLPPELQLMLLRYLDFADIERVRRTCKTLRALASPQQIRLLFGPTRLHVLLLGHCQSCLLHDPYRARLLLATPADAGYPLASRCILCVMAADARKRRASDRTFLPGRKVHLANCETVWVCRWCGWPIAGDTAAYEHEQYHARCFRVYNITLVVWLCLGCVKLAVGVTAATLSWRYYRSAVPVVAPTVISFVLLWLCVLTLFSRSQTTYRWRFSLELAIFSLWIPPIYHVAKAVVDTPGEPVSKSTRAVLAMSGLNMVFRLLSVLGNVVILYKYDVTRHCLPSQPLWRRLFVNPVMSGLIFWTHPQAIERPAHEFC